MTRKANSKEIFEVLLIVKKVFDELEIPFFLTHGLALGVYRDKEFVDADIDIGLNGTKYKDRHKDIEKTFAKYGIKLITNIGRKTWKKDLPTFTKCVKCFEDKRLTIDIAYHYQEGNYIWKGIEARGGIREAFSSYLFESFKTVKFKNVLFLIPNPPEKYLEEIYGKTWKIKDPNWHWKNSLTLKKAKIVFKD